MATLGTQNISTSYPQVLKTYGSNIVDGTLRAIASGDEAGVSALQISTTGAKSTGTLAVDGTSLLSGVVTFGTSLTASTGTATIGTLSASTATISTATIPAILGATTFGSTITASTGTNTLGTISVNTATIGTLSTLNGLSVTTTATIGTLSVSNGAAVTTTATIGTAKIGASGPSITKLSYGTAAFTSATVQQYNAADATTGTFALTGAALGDIVCGSINSLGSATGTTNISLSFFPVATDVVRYSIKNQGSTNGTIPAGTIFATAIRLTA